MPDPPIQLLRPPSDEFEIINAWADPSAEPLASILCITYNHVAFIADAIDSFLAQKTSFPFQIIIHDDASDDGTSDIVRDYVRRYPNIVKAIIQDTNLYSRGLSRLPSIRPLLKGSYIAFCEGDDYWVDTDKLQIQIDFLQDSPDYSLSYHNAYLLQTRGGSYHFNIFHQKELPETYTTKDLIKPWFLPTASRVARTEAFLSMPEWTPPVESGDIGSLLLTSLSGKLKYFNRPMSVYRIHDGGMSAEHKGNRKAFAMVHLYQCFNLQTQRVYQDLLWRESIYELKTHLDLASKIEIMSSLPPEVVLRHVPRLTYELKTHLDLASKIEIMSSLSPEVVLRHGLRLTVNSSPFLRSLVQRMPWLKRLASRLLQQ